MAVLNSFWKGFSNGCGTLVKAWKPWACSRKIQQGHCVSISGITLHPYWGGLGMNLSLNIV